MIRTKNYFYLLIIYMVLTITFKIFNYNFYLNIFAPIFTTLTLISIIIYLKQFPISKNSKYLKDILLITILSLIIYLSLGLVFGFTKNYSEYNLISIIINIKNIMITTITLELLRNILITNNKKNKLIVIIITILIILIELNYHTLITLKTKSQLFKYLFSNILILITDNILMSYLSIKNSYLSLLNQVLIKLTLILLPIIPNLDWFLIGSFNLIKVTIIYLIFKYKIAKEKILIKKTSFALISYAFTLFFATFLIFFMAGSLKYEPIAILSNSMIPTFKRGDVLVFKKLNSKEINNLKPGMIIVYQIGNKDIVHRIVKVIKNNDKVSYKTKGDNNNTSDNLIIKTSNIKGVVKFHIKYLGYPAVYLNEYLKSGD